VSDRPVHAAYAACPPEPTVHTAHLGATAAEFTPADILGPYWTPGSPARTDFLAEAALGDDAVHLSGTVRDRHGDPLAGVTVDVWQADPAGFYSGGFPDQQGYVGPALGFRGHQVTGADGRYALRTVRPGRYKISDTQERCAHLHFRLTAPAGTRAAVTLVTQLYFPDDPVNAVDPWERKNDPKLLMTRLVDSDQPEAYAFDFVLRTA
jgi:protocatechuate 3,4-dioxygenase beta subunit